MNPNHTITLGSMNRKNTSVNGLDKRGAISGLTDSTAMFHSGRSALAINTATIHATGNKITDGVFNTNSPP